MKSIHLLLLLTSMVSCSAQENSATDKGWVSLFDGKSFTNWTPSDNAETFRIDSGMIIVNGNRSHLYYTGPLRDHQFKNFELKVRVMTTPGSNSGIYFHTQYKPTGWPSKGYEVQVNNSHTDWRRTGSLYGVQDIRETYVKDYEWYTEYIKVEGKHITIKINDKTVVDYIEPEGIENTKGREEKHTGTGTFALQGHDPKSKVYYKEVLVRLLPD
jgi:hypothetical protein